MKKSTMYLILGAGALYALSQNQGGASARASRTKKAAPKKTATQIAQQKAKRRAM